MRKITTTWWAKLIKFTWLSLSCDYVLPTLFRVKISFLFWDDGDSRWQLFCLFSMSLLCKVRSWLPYVRPQLFFEIGLTHGREILWEPWAREVNWRWQGWRWGSWFSCCALRPSPGPGAQCPTSGLSPVPGWGSASPPRWLLSPGCFALPAAPGWRHPSRHSSLSLPCAVTLCWPRAMIQTMGLWWLSNYPQDLGEPSARCSARFLPSLVITGHPDHSHTPCLWEVGNPHRGSQTSGNGRVISSRLMNQRGRLHHESFCPTWEPCSPLDLPQ
jgi:hypothetical protein